MKKITNAGRVLRNGCAAAVFCLVPLAVAHAEDSVIPGSFSGSTMLASQYIFRGVSLSDDKPAIQGNIDYNLGGFHAGVWGSSGQFGDGGNIETDITVGYGGEASGITYDLSVVNYRYPGDNVDGNYIEVIGTIGHDFGIASADVGGGYTPKGQAALSNDDAMYLFTDVNVPIPNTPLTANFHVGYEDFGMGGTRMHWNAGLTATFMGLDWSAQYVDTNRPGHNLRARALFTVSKSF